MHRRVRRHSSTRAAGKPRDSRADKEITSRPCRGATRWDANSRVGIEDSGDDRPSTLRLETEHTELSAGTMLAIPYFRAGQSVAETAVAIGRAESTVHKYLCEYLVHEVVMDWNPWVSDELAERIQAAALNSPDRKLKPIFEALDGTATYEEIRITLICLQNRGAFE
jgi:ATP-dependent DNA helicase RecQ